jgi:hypothetical protein
MKTYEQIASSIDGKSVGGQRYTRQQQHWVENDITVRNYTLYLKFRFSRTVLNRLWTRAMIPKHIFHRIGTIVTGAVNEGRARIKRVVDVITQAINNRRLA